MTEILTDNQICYWLTIGIILGAAVVGVFAARYMYDMTIENKALRRENDRISAYLNYKERNAFSLGD